MGWLGIFFLVISSYITLFVAVRSKKMMLLLHILSFVQELWNSRSHPKTRLSLGWGQLDVTCCWPVPAAGGPGDESAASSCRRLGAQQGFLVTQQLPSNPRLSPSKSRRNLAFNLSGQVLCLGYLALSGLLQGLLLTRSLYRGWHQRAPA